MSSIWSVVKANAYGHGLMRVSQCLAPVTDGFALVEFDGAIALRESGVHRPILMLEGCYSPDDWAVAAHYNLTVVVHSMGQLRGLISARMEAPVSLYLKLNTGMNRLGLMTAELPQAVKLLQKAPNVKSVTLMTHFADADGERGVAEPLALFNQMRAGLDWPVSMANSASVLRYPETAGDWVRPGIMLYGSSPFADQTALDFDLLPVMSLRSQLIAVRNLQSGDRVGYGGDFVAPKSMRIGIVACGYGDGYPRHAPTGTPIVVDGVRTRTLGRVSMDKLCVDLDPVPTAEVGSNVLLWGRDDRVILSADEVALAAGTIAYELFCALAPRVPVQEVLAS